MTWHDAREIGEALFEQFDTLNPLTVRFTDLHKHVLNLEGFEGKPNESNEKAPRSHPDGVVRGVEGRVRRMSDHCPVPPPAGFSAGGTRL